MTASMLLFNSSCKDNKKIVAPLVIEFEKEGTLTLYRSDSDSIITTFDIETAEDDYEIQRGLMDRQSMEENQGMLFIFPDLRPRAFYMKNTLISLDIIYFDNNRSIVKIWEHTVPLDESSLPSDVPVQYVLELNAGQSEKLGLKPGDRMEFLEAL